MTPLEQERQRRIRVALAAWAYERYDSPIMPDADFDILCRAIQPGVDTGHAVMDKFFSTKFNPSTGQWIYSHPELDRIDAILRREFPDIGKEHEEDSTCSE